MELSSSLMSSGIKPWRPWGNLLLLLENRVLRWFYNGVANCFPLMQPFPIFSFDSNNAILPPPYNGGYMKIFCIQIWNCKPCDVGFLFPKSFFIFLSLQKSAAYFMFTMPQQQVIITGLNLVQLLLEVADFGLYSPNTSFFHLLKASLVALRQWHTVYAGDPVVLFLHASWITLTLLQLVVQKFQI